MSPRPLIALLLFVGLGAAVYAIVVQGQLPPADFTFNNATEIESLDPAVVTGQPEGRIIDSLYEGLVRLDAENRAPGPGMAERWEVSEDGRTYTFHLRKDAVWSNGEPVTAHDIVYSMRRFLSPDTAAEYAYQAWYLVNGKRYSLGASTLEPGDRVEVELLDAPEGSLPYARGEVLRGELVAIETDPAATEAQLADPAEYSQWRTFVVAVDGSERRFRPTDSAPEGVEPCRWVLLDFGEVGFRALDDWTVETVLDAPTPYWLELLGFYPLSPVNKTCLETHGPLEWKKPGNLVTNGPYRLEFHRLRDRIRLKKNPDYWDAENVAIETIDALTVESLTTSFNLYETGEVDWIPTVDPLIARELLAADPPRDDINPSPQLGTYFYTINVTRPPLDDPRVRKALILALDRQQVVDTACAGEQPARSLTPPGLPGYEPPTCPPTDPEQAKRLLAEAGFPDGNGFPKIEILYNNTETHQTIAELVRKQWRRNLGVNVATRNEEWGSYLSSQRGLDFDVMRRAWIGDYLDPNTFLDMFVTGGENNNTGWSNARYDELIELAKYEVDKTARLELLTEAETLLMSEGPVLPIYFYVAKNMVRPYVRGFYNNLQDTHPLWTMSIDHAATAPNEFMRSRVSREVAE